MSDLPDPLVRAIEALENVDRRLGEVTEAQEHLAAQQRRSRTQMAVLAVSVVLDVVLSAGLAYSLHKTNDTLTRVERNADTLHAICLATNESNEKQVDLWERTLALPRQPGEPPTPPETLRAFRAILADTYPQKDCRRVGGN